MSDLHYSLPQFDWVLEASADYDLVVVAGDSLNIASPVALDAQSVVISRYLSLIAATTTLAVSSGNHDLTGPDSHGEQSALWLRDVRAPGNSERRRFARAGRHARDHLPLVGRATEPG